MLPAHFRIADSHVQYGTPRARTALWPCMCMDEVGPRTPGRACPFPRVLRLVLALLLIPRVPVEQQLAAAAAAPWLLLHELHGAGRRWRQSTMRTGIEAQVLVEVEVLLQEPLPSRYSWNCRRQQPVAVIHGMAQTASESKARPLAPVPGAQAMGAQQ